MTPYVPTTEQAEVINLDGSAFVSACPGAGKTRAMVERARKLLGAELGGRGIALLSFTREAVSQMESRLRSDGLLESRVFPHFIGTFDSFIWQFLVAPFGIPGTDARPVLIADKGERLVQPFEKAQPLPLHCFDRNDGRISEERARRCGFDVAVKKSSLLKAMETAARKMNERFRARGELDFDDARAIAKVRLSDSDLAGRLGVAISRRFIEVIVDEVQDCSPDDLLVVDWIRQTPISIKLVGDPHQSIYGFRGGVAGELLTFRSKFDPNRQLKLTGNFRSSETICRAVACLRRKDSRGSSDQALGKFRAESSPIYVLSYTGKVTGSIGAKFTELVEAKGLAIADCPVLAATRNTGSNAIGQPVVVATKDLTFRLAEAVSNFYFSFDHGSSVAAIVALHKIILELEGKLEDKTYDQYLTTTAAKSGEWRPKVISLVRQMKFDPEKFPDPDSWHEHAKAMLAPYLPRGGPSISQRLKKNKAIASLLVPPRSGCPAAKTIHSVKGMEFPAVCVVTVAATLKGILDYLESDSPKEHAESARELYVASSRASQLLAIAAPKSQADRIAKHLSVHGAQVVVTTI